MTIEVCKSTIDKFCDVIAYIVIYGLVGSGIYAIYLLIEHTLSFENYMMIFPIIMLSIADIYGWYLIFSDLNEHFKFFKIIPCDKKAQHAHDNVEVKS